MLRKEFISEKDRHTGHVSSADLNPVKLGVVARSLNKIDLCAESK